MNPVHTFRCREFTGGSQTKRELDSWETLRGTSSPSPPANMRVSRLAAGPPLLLSASPGNGAMQAPEGATAVTSAHGPGLKTTASRQELWMFRRSAQKPQSYCSAFTEGLWAHLLLLPCRWMQAFGPSRPSVSLIFTRMRSKFPSDSVCSIQTTARKCSKDLRCYCGSNKQTPASSCTTRLEPFQKCSKVKNLWLMLL